MKVWFALVFIATGVLAQEIELRDPVTKLQKQIADGKVQLSFHQELGYLPSLLKALKISESSQGLVFSKTSLQLHHIHPQAPRALYFNDDVYVGYTTGGDLLEIASIDPDRGPVFFGLEQNQAEKPKFQRREDCLQCHQSPRTFDMPGLLVRSVWTLPSGYPDFKQGGGFNTTDSSPMKERWGGWYVSGTLESDVHMGNQVLRGEPESVDLSHGANVTDLEKLLDTDRYLTPHSDLVALMVLEHQAQLHNLITRANLGSRTALEQNKAIAEMFGLKPGEWTDSTKRRIKTVTEALVKGLLFRDEYRLKGRVEGTSSFAEEFQKLGPFDSKKRSLRDLDLETRLLKYPCSWLIYSESFDALLPEIKAVIYARMKELLDNPEGRATLEILKETKPGFGRESLPSRPKPAANN